MKASLFAPIIILAISACSSNQQPRTLNGINEQFSHQHNGDITSFTLTGTRIDANEAITLNKREITSTKKQAIKILEWHLSNRELCNQGYLLTQQTISAALIKLRGECL